MGSSFVVPGMYRVAFWLVFTTGSAFPSDLRLLSPFPGLGVRPWSSGVKLHRLPKALDGILTLSNDGVEFRSAKNSPIHWTFDDIRVVDLKNQWRLSLVTYQNSRWHLPGDRPFDFTLKNKMPPEVAGELVRRVGKPAINGDPDGDVKNFAAIPARHKTPRGGSGGLLRFTDAGIDYISKAGDSRSWRWSDIETLAHPAPYRLRIGGYLETFDFELKEPLAGDLFDRLWDHIYAQPPAEGAPNPKTF